MPKPKKPEADGSVLLTIFNPYCMPSTYGSILASRESSKQKTHRLKSVIRWLGAMGVTISELFAKRTEIAIVVNAQDTEDKSVIEAVIGMHKWAEFLQPCPSNYKDEISHIFRCTSDSIDHLESTLGFEMVDVDEWTDGKDDHKLIANPYPPPVLPTSNWPRPQGPIPIYIRPKMQIPRPVTEVELDDFLAGIAPAPETLPKPEISATKEEPNDELTSADIEFESQEDRFFEGLNANVSRLLREKSISQLPLSDVQGPDSNGNPSSSTTQTNVEHNVNQSGSKMNHNTDRKPLKSELEDLNVKYGKTYTAKQEEQEAKLFTLKREHEGEDTRDSKKHRRSLK